MLQHSKAEYVPLSLSDVVHLSNDRLLAAAIIAFADPDLDSRIVVHGASTLELQCALLRQGCANVFALRQDNWPLTDTIDVVLLPNIARLDDLAREIAQARRVLPPLGIVVMHLVAQGTDTLVRHASRLLAWHGFEAVAVRAVARGTLCRAELPPRHRLARA